MPLVSILVMPQGAAPPLLGLLLRRGDYKFEEYAWPCGDQRDLPPAGNAGTGCGRTAVQVDVVVRIRDGRQHRRLRVRRVGAPQPQRHVTVRREDHSVKLLGPPAVLHGRLVCPCTHTPWLRRSRVGVRVYMHGLRAFTGRPVMLGPVCMHMWTWWGEDVLRLQAVLVH